MAENETKVEDVEETLPEDVEVAGTEVEEEEKSVVPEVFPAAVTPTVEKKMYAGKEVISDTTRMVNGVEYHHIHTSEGTDHDLTDAEYVNQVVIVQ